MAAPCGSAYPKKALIAVLKEIIDEIDDNKACNACCNATARPASPAAPPPAQTRALKCRLPMGKSVPPLISEPDYRLRGLDDWAYVIPLPEPLCVRSRELIASKLYQGCACSKKNGLQDDCRRWDCRGAPTCCKNSLCKNSGGAGCDGTLCRKG